MAEIKVEKNIYESLQDVRYEIAKTPLKKSGFNSHLKFNYFELADFVPTATKLFAERGMCPIFSIKDNPAGNEMAVLTIVKGAEQIVFCTPTDNPTNMGGIQALGAKITYLRRYLYLIALDLVENDVVDASLDKDSNKPPVQTINNDQWTDLNMMYSKEEIKEMYKELGITNGKQIPFDYYIEKKKAYDKKFREENQEQKFY